MKPKDQKRLEAEARNERWSGLPIKSQIKELKKRPGNCAKQLKRLEDKL
jgi:hypothetical protein